MINSFLLPIASSSVEVFTEGFNARFPHVNINAPAASVMIDYLREPPLTVEEDQGLDDIMDDMLRLDTRAFLVVRAQRVVGLITADDIRSERLARFLRGGNPERRNNIRVGDVMIDASDVPAIDWQTVAQATVGEVREIFQGTGFKHLVVVENISSVSARVRGMIHRSRLEQQLGLRDYN